jgi:hypothetical protein
MAEVVEHLPHNQEALNSNLSTAKKKKKGPVSSKWQNWGEPRSSDSETCSAPTACPHEDKESQSTI